MRKHSNAESIIATVLNEVASAFPDDTPKNVRELLDHGEPGVALEVLYAQLIEYQIEVSPDLKSRMRTAADLMGMSIANLDGASE